MKGPVIVTGGTGFVGRWLLKLLKSKHPQVRVISWGTRDLISSDTSHDFLEIDITSKEDVAAAIRTHRPEALFHLAAITSIAEAESDEQRAFAVNVEGTFHLAQAVLAETPRCTFVHVSTSEVYGHSFQHYSGGLTEDVELHPTNAYARSKVQAERVISALVQQGLRALIFRPFNHTGPGQDERFVIPSFAAQIARIEAGEKEPIIHVGNLDAQRDFLDVRDVAAAYIQAVERDGLESGRVYNLASQQPRRISDVLELLLAMSERRIDVTVDPNRMRPSDIPVAIGDASRASREFGWEPNIPWSQTLTDVLTSFRQKLAGKAKLDHTFDTSLKPAGQQSPN